MDVQAHLDVVFAAARRELFRHANDGHGICVDCGEKHPCTSWAMAGPFLTKEVPHEDRP